MTKITLFFERLSFYSMRFFHVWGTADFITALVKTRRFLLLLVKRYWFNLRYVRQSKDDVSPLLRLSYVIPVYDRTDELRAAIASVLNQTVEAIELILVCDGSPPETMRVIDEFRDDPRVRVFWYPHSSGTAVRGRNKGILESRGEFVAFLDSDDLAAPERSALTLSAFDRGVDVVYGAYQVLMDGSRNVDDLKDGQIIFSPDASPEELVRNCIPCQSTAAVRKSWFIRCGYLKPQMRYKEDQELWARLARAGAKFYSIPAVLSSLRLHSGNNELTFTGEQSRWQSLLEREVLKKGPSPRKIAFVLPGLGVSGGIAVVFRHANMLVEAGHDVLIINTGYRGDGAWYGQIQCPIYHLEDSNPSYVFDNIDVLIATGWSTARYLSVFKARSKAYFVQSDERRFVDDAHTKQLIERTYRTECHYLTEAKWIQRLLMDEFGHAASYVPNGIDLDVFYPDPDRAGPKRKKRVLIEGPIDIPFKGMADAYAAIQNLDCEIWIVSSAGTPPAGWRYDRFFEAVHFRKMREIYSSCDILLKMSRVEGFYGPPMEAMACDCAVVTSKVTGYDEYIRDGFNALVVDAGDVSAASRAVSRLLEDDALLASLVAGGRATVSEWGWDKSAQAMREFVERVSSGAALETPTAEPDLKIASIAN